MYIVLAVNETDSEYICTYGPFDSTDAAGTWITGRMDNGRFNYSTHPLRNPNAS